MLGRKTCELAVVVIGRNEGKRLEGCLRSLRDVHASIYVDSGSVDNSVQIARRLNADVIELDISGGFTAARARNAGFARVCKVYPDIGYVQFVDGDCELEPDWMQDAANYLTQHSDVGAVCGRLRERFPDRSIYNWLCEHEWRRSTGEIEAFAGNVMIRADALQAVGGYRDDVIAAEDDELSVRLRLAGWRLWRLEKDMAQHDAAMMHFGQWWRRTLRSGYAFAQGAYIHGKPPERHFANEVRRAWLWGIWMPVTTLVLTLTVSRWAGMFLLIYPLQILRLSLRNIGSIKDRLLLAFFQVLGRFPEGLGQVKFLRDRILGERPRLIEHK